MSKQIEIEVPEEDFKKIRENAAMILTIKGLKYIAREQEDARVEADGDDFLEFMIKKLILNDIKNSPILEGICAIDKDKIRFRLPKQRTAC